MYTKCLVTRIDIGQLVLDCGIDINCQDINGNTALTLVSIVLEVIKGEKQINVIAAEYNIQPNFIRNWRKNSLSSALTIDETINQVSTLYFIRFFVLTTDPL